MNKQQKWKQNNNRKNPTNQKPSLNLKLKKPLRSASVNFLMKSMHTDEVVYPVYKRSDSGNGCSGLTELYFLMLSEYSAKRKKTQP